MKHKTPSVILAMLCSGLLTAQAQLSIPSDGSDGAFSPASNVEIDLGQAATGVWNAAGAGHGVYDPEKWAVVFKFSSVDIPAGVTVTFKNHPTYAPVVWLVQGDVNIAGELNLDGKAGTDNTVGALTPAEPGPGGFRGGPRGPSGNSWGYGPGASAPDVSIMGPGSIGRYALAYGNPQIVPLIGGSGSGTRTGNVISSGSGGGGAIAIFARATTITGKISALGGVGNFNSTVGAGGAVKIVSDSVSGAGVIQCVNGAYAPNENAGRIRIETSSLSPTVQLAPETIGVPPANPPVIWPAANAPTARVVSVDAVPAPTDPRAPLVAGADVAIQNSDEVVVFIETQNFPIEGVVQLNITPKFGSRTTLNAARLSGDITSATWRVQTTLPVGFVTLQARATQP